MNLNDCILNPANKSKPKFKFIATTNFEKPSNQDQELPISSRQSNSRICFSERNESTSSKKNPNSSNWGSAFASVVTSSSSRKSNSSKVTEENQRRTIIALTEGRGQARCEVGIAVINISSPILIICQISDTQNYINTLTKINIFNPTEILFPNTFEHFGGNRLITKIKELFPKIKYTGVPRSIFNKNSGLDMLSQLCLPSLNGIVLILRHRYYALAATSAVLTYIQDNLYIYYASGSLKIDYQESEGYALIDVATADRLELVCSAKPAQANKYSSLLGILNQCQTKIGTRMLRSWILQPLFNIDYINNRLKCVEELRQNREILSSLQILLQKLNNTDTLLNLATLVPENTQKCSFRQLNYILNLNSIIDLLNPLKDILSNLNEPFFVNMRKTLEDPSFAEIRSMVREVMAKDAQPTKCQSAIHQRCYAINAGVNGLLDVVRKIYSERVNDMIDYVLSLSQKYNMALTLGNNQKKGYHIVLRLNKQQRNSFKKSDIPDEFIEVQRSANFFTMKTPKLTNISTRVEDILEDILKISNVIVYNIVANLKKHLSLFYTFCEDIAQLDVYLSLAQTSLENNYIQPQFGEFTEIKKGQHPLLDFLLPTKPIANSIFCSEDYNVHIITGPNGAGKSIFIRQMMLLQVMAQIGSYVPAEFAIFKPVNKMFARIYLDDNMEFNASSYVLEMKEIKYIMNTMSEDSLVIIDELGRSTSVEEGVSIAIAIVEKLSTFRSHIFVTTHFKKLAQLSLIYPHIKTWQMETNPNGDNPRTFKLDYKYSLIPGITKVDRYGVYIARNIWPDDMVKVVDESLDYLETVQCKSIITPLDPKLTVKYNIECELSQLKSRRQLCVPKIKEIVFKYVQILKELKCYDINNISISNNQSDLDFNLVESQSLENLSIMSTQEYLLHQEPFQHIFSPEFSNQNSICGSLDNSNYPLDNTEFIRMLQPIVTLKESFSTHNLLDTSISTQYSNDISLPLNNQNIPQNFEMAPRNTYKFYISPEVHIIEGLNNTTQSCCSENEADAENITTVNENSHGENYNNGVNITKSVGENYLSTGYTGTWRKCNSDNSSSSVSCGQYISVDNQDNRDMSPRISNEEEGEGTKNIEKAVMNQPEHYNSGSLRKRNLSFKPFIPPIPGFNNRRRTPISSTSSFEAPLSNKKHPPKNIKSLFVVPQTENKLNNSLADSRKKIVSKSWRPLNSSTTSYEKDIATPIPLETSHNSNMINFQTPDSQINMWKKHNSSINSQRTEHESFISSNQISNHSTPKKKLDANKKKEVQISNFAKNTTNLNKASKSFTKESHEHSILETSILKKNSELEIDEGLKKQTNVSEEHYLNKQTENLTSKESQEQNPKISMIPRKRPFKIEKLKFANFKNQSSLEMNVLSAPSTKRNLESETDQGLEMEKNNDEIQTNVFKEYYSNKQEENRTSKESQVLQNLETNNMSKSNLFNSEKSNPRDFHEQPLLKTSNLNTSKKDIHSPETVCDFILEPNEERTHVNVSRDRSSEEESKESHIGNLSSCKLPRENHFSNTEFTQQEQSILDTSISSANRKRNLESETAESSKSDQNKEEIHMDISRHHCSSDEEETNKCDMRNLDTYKFSQGNRFNDDKCKQQEQSILDTSISSASKKRNLESEIDESSKSDQNKEEIHMDISRHYYCSDEDESKKSEKRNFCSYKLSHGNRYNDDKYKPQAESILDTIVSSASKTRHLGSGTKEKSQSDQNKKDINRDIFRHHYCSDKDESKKSKKRNLGTYKLTHGNHFNDDKRKQQEQSILDSSISSASRDRNLESGTDESPKSDKNKEAIHMDNSGHHGCSNEDNSKKFMKRTLGNYKLTHGNRFNNDKCKQQEQSILDTSVSSASKKRNLESGTDESSKSDRNKEDIHMDNSRRHCCSNEDNSKKFVKRPLGSYKLSNRNRFNEDKCKQQEQSILDTSVSSASKKRNLESGTDESSKSDQNKAQMDISRYYCYSDDGESKKPEKRNLGIYRLAHKNRLIGQKSEQKEQSILDTSISSASREKNFKFKSGTDVDSKSIPKEERIRINIFRDHDHSIEGENHTYKEFQIRNLDTYKLPCENRFIEDKVNLQEQSILDTSVSSASRKRNLETKTDESSKSDQNEEGIHVNISRDHSSSNEQEKKRTSKEFQIRNQSILETCISMASKNRNLESDASNGLSKWSQREEDISQASTFSASRHHNLNVASNEPKGLKIIRRIGRKFVPPRKLSAKQIREEFEEQDRKLLQRSPSSSNISKYLEQKLNRPSVQQIQNTTYLGTFRKTANGLQVLTAVPETTRKHTKALIKTFSGEIDMTIFSDRNANTFEQFINSGEKNFRNFHFNKPNERDSEKTLFSFNKNNENFFNYYMNCSENKKCTTTQSSGNTTLTPSGFYKENKEDIQNLIRKYVQEKSPIEVMKSKDDNIFDNSHLSDEDFEL